MRFQEDYYLKGARIFISKKLLGENIMETTYWLWGAIKRKSSTLECRVEYKEQNRYLDRPTVMFCEVKLSAQKL